MEPIPAEILDPVNYSDWENAAGSYLTSIRRSRADALTLLGHEDWNVRNAAVMSFVYVWDFDRLVAKKFLEIATNDNHDLVRFNAGGYLMLIHRRCKWEEDRKFLESLMDAIIKTPDQVPDLVEELESFLEGRTGITAKVG